MTLDQHSQLFLTSLVTHARSHVEQSTPAPVYAVLAAVLVMFALVLLKRAVEPIGPLLRAAAGFMGALLLLGIALALLAAMAIAGR